MGLFEKREKIFEVKGDKPAWKKMRQVLKDAGLTGVRTVIWEDEVGGCGCGPRIDNRDFGANGRIDREIYSIRVRVSDVDTARKLVYETFPDYKPYEPKPDRLKMS